MHLCIHCKHHWFNGKKSFCIRDDFSEHVVVNLVTGEQIPWQEKAKKYSCKKERAEKASQIEGKSYGTFRFTCGIEGKYWERKK
jgi:hypothetical protein